MRNCYTGEEHGVTECSLCKKIFSNNEEMVKHHHSLRLIRWYRR